MFLGRFITKHRLYHLSERIKTLEREHYRPLIVEEALQRRLRYETLLREPKESYRDIINPPATYFRHLLVQAVFSTIGGAAGTFILIKTVLED